MKTSLKFQEDREKVGKFCFKSFALIFNSVIGERAKFYWLELSISAIFSIEKTLKWCQFESMACIMSIKIGKSGENSVKIDF